jgi:predicted small integral membrane protein
MSYEDDPFSPERLISLVWDSICFFVFSRMALGSWNDLFVENGGATFQTVIKRLSDWQYAFTALYLVASVVCVLCAISHIILLSGKRKRSAIVFRKIQNMCVIVIVVAGFTHFYLVLHAFSNSGGMWD